MTKLNKKDIDFKSFSSKIYFKIKIARIDSGMTQKELADKIGTAQEEISRIENGKRNVTLELLFLVIKHLDLNLIIEKYA